MRRAAKWVLPALLAGTIILTRAGALDGRAAVGVAIGAEVLFALVAGWRLIVAARRYRRGRGVRAVLEEGLTAALPRPFAHLAIVELRL